MTHRTAKNLRSAIRLAMEGNPLGCELLQLYLNPENPPIVRALVTFVLCAYCNYTIGCKKALTYLYTHGKITYVEYEKFLKQFKKS